MKTIYKGVLYTMTIEDSGGTRFTFEYIKLSATQARKIIKDMFFFGVRVREISLKEV